MHRVWSISTGDVLNILIHHSEAVLHLRYSEDYIMVTCSKVCENGDGDDEGGSVSNGGGGSSDGEGEGDDDRGGCSIVGGS